MKDVFKIVSIADIHFGTLDPLYTYTQLKKQVLDRLVNLDFDIFAICGDLFDARYMSNNPIVSYAILFINDLVQLCASRNASLIIIEGTQSHDNGQLSLFYHYAQDPMLDVRIVEEISFEYVKGLKILCIPEKYGIPESEYQKAFFENGRYDLCLLHGTYKNSYRGSEIATLKSNHAPVFSMNVFENCAGPILMGHYHKAGCYEQYAYYNGSPLRFSFGEEEDKGFLVTLYNPHNRRHYTELIPIDSYIYHTVNINHLLNRDPKEIIDWIKNEKEKNGIDFLRVQFNNPGENMNIVRNYFRTSNHIKLDELDKKDRQMQEVDQTILEQNKQYSYILDNSIDDYSKFVMYVNQNEGYDFISTDELIKLLEGDI